MKILVCGGRDYSDQGTVARVLDDYERESAQLPTLIHGAARGADTIAAVYAECRGWQVERYPAEWGKYGTYAGPLRNRRMLDEGKPDLVIAFAGGRGTADMIRRAEKAGVQVRRVP